MNKYLVCNVNLMRVISSFANEDDAQKEIIKNESVLFVCQETHAKLLGLRFPDERSVHDDWVDANA